MVLQSVLVVSFFENVALASKGPHGHCGVVQAVEFLLLDLPCVRSYLLQWKEEIV